MASLMEAATRANLSLHKMQIDREGREIRFIPIVEAAAMKHGKNCHCEACSSLNMQRTRDRRMKAMMPGNVDVGNRQPATMGKAKKMKSDANLMMKKQVPPKKESSDHIKPSSLIHDKGKILKGKHIGFKKLKQKLGHEKGITNPGGLAYEIGEEKYGKKGMTKKSKAGK